MKTSYKLRALAFMTLATVFIAGCSTTPSGPTTTTPTTHTLKTGDSFTFHDTSLDTNGVLIPGSDSVEIFYTTATGQTYMGRTDVTVLVANKDTSRVAQLPNEGIARYQDPITVLGFIIPGVWVSTDTLTSSKTFFDSTATATVSGVAATVHATITASRGSDATLVPVSGSTAVKVHRYIKVVKVVVDIPAFSNTSTTTATITYLYAPSIGYFTSVSDSNYSDSKQSPIPNGTNNQVLTSYSE
jgi:hypothetical protein